MIERDRTNLRRLNHLVLEAMFILKIQFQGLIQILHCLPFRFAETRNIDVQALRDEVLSLFPNDEVEWRRCHSTYSISHRLGEVHSIATSNQSFFVLLFAWLVCRLLPTYAPRELLTAQSVGVKVLSFVIAMLGLSLLAIG